MRIRVFSIFCLLVLGLFTRTIEDEVWDISGGSLLCTHCYLLVCAFWHSFIKSMILR